jgi:hypothetical protein
MNTAEKCASKNVLAFSDRLIIFAFFLAGAAASYFCSFSFPSALSPRLFLCGMLGLMLLSSASLFGNFLLPICALAAGSFSEQIAGFCVSSWLEGVREYRVIFGSAVLVPVFFLCAVHGMAVSGTVQAVLERGGPSVREVCRREIIILVFFAIVGLAAIFYFT